MIPDPLPTRFVASHTETHNGEFLRQKQALIVLNGEKILPLGDDLTGQTKHLMANALVFENLSRIFFDLTLQDEHDKEQTVLRSPQGVSARAVWDEGVWTAHLLREHSPVHTHHAHLQWDDRKTHSLRIGKSTQDIVHPPTLNPGWNPQKPEIDRPGLGFGRTEHPEWPTSKGPCMRAWILGVLTTWNTLHTVQNLTRGLHLGCLLLDRIRQRPQSLRLPDQTPNHVQNILNDLFDHTQVLAASDPVGGFEIQITDDARLKRLITPPKTQDFQLGQGFGRFLTENPPARLFHHIDDKGRTQLDLWKTPAQMGTPLSIEDAQKAFGILQDLNMKHKT